PPFHRPGRLHPRQQLYAMRDGIAPDARWQAENGIFGKVLGKIGAHPMDIDESNIDDLTTTNRDPSTFYPLLRQIPVNQNMQVSNTTFLQFDYRNEIDGLTMLSFQVNAELAP